MSELTWPLPKFYFTVEIDGTEMSFQSVEGLEAEVNVIEYRHSNSKEFSKIKMPGLTTYTNVTLKRGVFNGDVALYDWFSQIGQRSMERKTVLIKLMDETDAPALTWNLNNCFPVKFTPSELNSEDDGEPAIEELEIAFESFTQE